MKRDPLFTPWELSITPGICAGLSSTAELPLLVLFGFENNDFFELLNLFEDKDDLLHLQIFRTVSHVITSLLCEVVQLMSEC
jgi:hypothetical protein